MTELRGKSHISSRYFVKCKSFLRRKNIISIAILVSLIIACNPNADNSADDGSMQPSADYEMPNSIEEIKQRLKDKCVDTIKFNKGETIADIGAGIGDVVAMLSVFNDSLTFYVQDIDTSVCNQKKINEITNSFQKFNPGSFTNKFIVVTGTDTKTNLPDNSCDKILMLWTYQYLKKPREFILDVRDKLKEEGKFYVINPDLDYEEGKMIREKYGWNEATVEQEIAEIINSGFKLIGISRNYDDPKQAYIMVFKKDKSVVLQ